MPAINQQSVPRSHVAEVVLKGDALHMAGGVPVVRFGPDVNVLAGPNGSGKSTILRVLRDRDWAQGQGCEVHRHGARNLEFVAFDGEQDNPRFKKDRGPLQFVDAVGSHGQVQRRVFKFIQERLATGTLVIMDEPEAALDIDGAWTLRKAIETRTDVQWIIASHHPVIWTMPSAQIIELHPGHVGRTLELWRRVVCG